MPASPDHRCAGGRLWVELPVLGDYLDVGRGLVDPTARAPMPTTSSADSDVPSERSSSCFDSAFNLFFSFARRLAR